MFYYYYLAEKYYEIEVAISGSLSIGECICCSKYTVDGDSFSCLGTKKDYIALM